MSKKAKLASSSPAHELAPSEKKRILLVDDDIDFLEVNRLALEGAGFEVLLAHDQGEALKIVGQTKIDVAILDVIMNTPDEGFVLARELRRNDNTKNMPLLMLTSINELNRAKGLFTFSDQDRDDSWLPIDRFLNKPIKPEELVTEVKQVLP